MIQSLSISVLFSFLLGIPFCAPFVGHSDPRLDLINLPDGFHIEIYASNVKNARQMALGSEGTLFVGSRSEGKVYAIPNRDGDFKGDSVIVIAEDLFMPSGLCYYQGDLYVAEVNKITVYRNIETNLGATLTPEVLVSDLPSEKHHGWKFIDVGPDGKLYVPVGAPCNVCEKEDPVFASILQMNLDGSDRNVYAHGLRNSVGFTWHPTDAALWITENGRDMMGDDIPSDEINRADKAGMHFGFPYFHQGDVPDEDFGKGKNASDYVAPTYNLGAHVAALGCAFYLGDMFPEKYRGQLFVMEHGSWNRSEPVGYRMVSLTIENNQVVKEEVFADGWLQGNDAWGRPVDVLELPDGSLLVSDDEGDMIYRISYSK